MEKVIITYNEKYEVGIQVSLRSATAKVMKSDVKLKN